MPTDTQDFIDIALATLSSLEKNNEKNKGEAPSAIGSPPASPDPTLPSAVTQDLEDTIEASELDSIISNVARGRPTGAYRPDGPQQPIKDFRPRHMEIIRYLSAGYTQREVADILEYTESRLSIIINSPLFQYKLREYQDKLVEKLTDNQANIENKVKMLQPKALDTIESIMDAKDTNRRLKRDCAKDILELGGNLGRKRDDEGMNDFARMIANAFKEANTKLHPINVIDIEPETEIGKAEASALGLQESKENEPPTSLDPTNE